MARKEGFIDVDPALVYFTHARVRPLFSGCGRRLEDTLNALLSNSMDIDALPVITVLFGAGGGGGDLLFSLNNRRLWVLKELRRAGKLTTVRVRSKEALPRERERYTRDRCSLTATLMGGSGSAKDGQETEQEDEQMPKPRASTLTVKDLTPTIVKQIKTLRKKLESGKERDVQASIDDYIDAGDLQADHEDFLWTLLR